MQEELNRILGTDFIVRDTPTGLKVNVPSLDVNQIGELWELYQRNYARNIKLKRSGTGITVIVTV